MTERATSNPKPATMTELFNLALDNLKKKGVDSQGLSKSNLSASTDLNRKLLDSIFVTTSFLNVVQPETETTLFGVKSKFPIFCSALSKPGYMTDDEMVEMVRGMGSEGLITMLGIGGSEQLQAAIDTGTPIVKVVKPYKDIDLIYKKIEDAQRRGCVAVGMDIDHFYGIFRDGRSMMKDTFSPKTADEITQIISSSNLPFIIKGVLSASDARTAIEMGASCIIVSNHAGASFDFGVPSIVALSEIVKSAGDQVTVLVDSGFRTGTDVFKGLALGAKGVGFGAPVLMASNAGGADYVSYFIKFIADELKRTMAIAGCASLESIGNSLLIPSPEIKQWW